MKVDRFWYANETATISAAWHYGSGLFSLLCLVFGIIFNGLVIFIFIKNNSLQRPRNYFLINLAIADIGLLITNSTMHLISSFQKKWIFGQAGCNFYSVCGGIFGLTSIATMAAISLTRLAAVNDPFSSMKLSSRFTLSCLVCVWMYGSVWILPPLFGWNRFILEGFGTSCTFDYISKDLWDNIFILVLVIGGFLIPLLLIILSYAFILIKLSQRSRRLISQNNDDDNNNSQQQDGTIYYFNKSDSLHQHRVRSETITASTLDCSIDDNNITRNIRRTEARATRTALLICIFFCTAWGPYALMAVISMFGFDYLANAYSTAMLGLFTKVAACINPLVYALSLNGFRKPICSYFKCLYQCDTKHHHHHHHRHHLMPLNSDIHRKRFSNLPDSTRIRQSDLIQ